jgi:hypothetical protein
MLLAWNGPEIVQCRFAHPDMPAINVAPLSVCAPTDAPFEPWIWIFV